jgi:hypothetical protein
MRTTIVIDDKLMADALKATGARTNREVVEMGLRALVQLKQQQPASTPGHPSPNTSRNSARSMFTPVSTTERRFRGNAYLTPFSP